MSESLWPTMVTLRAEGCFYETDAAGEPEWFSLSGNGRDSFIAHAANFFMEQVGVNARSLFAFGFRRVYGFDAIDEQKIRRTFLIFANQHARYVPEAELIPLTLSRRDRHFCRADYSEYTAAVRKAEILGQPELFYSHLDRRHRLYDPRRDLLIPHSPDPEKTTEVLEQLWIASGTTLGEPR